MTPVRRRLIRSILALAAWEALPVRSQVSPKVWRIGIPLTRFEAEALASRSVPVQLPFEEGLRELGWVDGKNIELLYRGGERGKDEAAVVAELLRLPLDVLVIFAPSNELELAMGASRTVPIVALMDQGAQSGNFKSLARPGGNVTGISMENLGGAATKRMALLKEIAPIKRLARLYIAVPGGTIRWGTEKELLPEYAVAARTLNLEVFPVFALGPAELRVVFAELDRRGGVGISVPMMSRLPGLEKEWDTLLELVQRYRIPAIYDEARAVDQGGLMSYGVDYSTRARRLAYFVDRILKGAKPADIPVEQPNSASLLVNLKAAETIGLKFPASTLLQADRLVQ
jgi:putative ABC transport system substrate-binding protein